MPVAKVLQTELRMRGLCLCETLNTASVPGALIHYGRRRRGTIVHTLVEAYVLLGLPRNEKAPERTLGATQELMASPGVTRDGLNRFSRCHGDVVTIYVYSFVLCQSFSTQRHLLYPKRAG